jgi:hypothetical protein
VFPGLLTKSNHPGWWPVTVASRLGASADKSGALYNSGVEGCSHPADCQAREVVGLAVEERPRVPAGARPRVCRRVFRERDRRCVTLEH